MALSTISSLVNNQGICFASNTSNTSTDQQQLVFIDTQVENYQLLANNINNSTSVFLINPDNDGIAQISSILKEHQNNYQEKNRSSVPLHIYIIAHGSPGCLHLGGKDFNLSNIKNYTKQLETWNIEYISLYACSVAEGDAGAEFINQLQNITGAKIAASAYPVGNAVLGGSWQLEINTGDVLAPLPVQSVAVLKDFPGIAAAK